MFLSRRSTQAEYFDAERPRGELETFYRSLGVFNRLFRFAHPFQHWLPHLLGTEACRSLSILDVGAGDGALGRELCQWAAERSWIWKLTNVDISATALGFNPKGSNVAGSAVALPCKNCSFDVVIASQMTHHFTDDRVIQLLREASRVASRLVLVSDLHRNLLLYSTLWLLLLRRSYPASFRSDALLSVCRGWRVEELRKLAMESGLRNAQVRLSFGARVILAFRKT